jgi:1-acyl-sn-glycerol-3-phosphate acyltransferase
MINPLAYMPWQTPDVKILEKAPLLCFMRCIPVHDTMGNREDPWVYKKIRKVIREGAVLIFPEGTRSGNTVSKKNILLYTKKNHIPIGNPRLGIGELIRTSDPTIIPILVKGAERVMPIGKPVPKFHKSKIEITFGVPKKSNHPPDEVLDQHRRKSEIRRWYAEQAMRRIAELDE